MNNRVIYTCFIIIAFVGCGELKEESIKNKTKNNNSEMILSKKRLSSKRIFFGHQSVGYNIIEGVTNEMKKDTLEKFNLMEGHSIDFNNEGVFAHEQIGENGDPKLKIDHFVEIIDLGIWKNIEIACLKFCYADFNANTDINEVFMYYKKNILLLEDKYPDLTLIHFTVPLRTIQTGVKAKVKLFFGKDIGLENNRTRNKFNDLLRKEFNNNRIFDIAEIQSTYPDCTKNYIISKGDTIYSMIPGYSNDGGHLSSEGKNIVGEKFILFFGEL